MTNELITDLKQEFYVWCSMLSIDEIASNPKLIKAIERLERKLLRAEYAVK